LFDIGGGWSAMRLSVRVSRRGGFQSAPGVQASGLASISQPAVSAAGTASTQS
jgi:hypothetical protein